MTGRATLAVSMLCLGAVLCGTVLMAAMHEVPTQSMYSAYNPAVRGDRAPVPTLEHAKKAETEAVHQEEVHEQQHPVSGDAGIDWSKFSGGSQIPDGSVIDWSKFDARGDIQQVNNVVDWSKFNGNNDINQVTNAVDWSKFDGHGDIDQVTNAVDWSKFDGHGDIDQVTNAVDWSKFNGNNDINQVTNAVDWSKFDAKGDIVQAPNAVDWKKFDGKGDINQVTNAVDWAKFDAKGDIAQAPNAVDWKKFDGKGDIAQAPNVVDWEQYNPKPKEEAAATAEAASLIQAGSFRTSKEQEYVDNAGLTGDADLDADDSVHRSEASSNAAAAEAQAAALAAAEAQHYKEAEDETSLSLKAEDKLKVQEAAYYEQAKKKADALAVAEGASAHQAAAVEPAQAQAAQASTVAAGVNAKEQVRVNLQRFQAFKAANRIVRRQTAKGRAAADLAIEGSAKALIATEKADVAQRHAARRAAEEQAALEFAADTSFLQTKQSPIGNEVKHELSAYNANWENVYNKAYKTVQKQEAAREPEIKKETAAEEAHLQSIYGHDNLKNVPTTTQYNKEWQAVMAQETAKIPAEMKAEDREVSSATEAEEKFLAAEYRTPIKEEDVVSHPNQPVQPAKPVPVQPHKMAHKLSPPSKKLRGHNLHKPSKSSRSAPAVAATRSDDWFESSTDDDSAFVRKEHRIAEEAMHRMETEQIRF